MENAPPRASAAVDQKETVRKPKAARRISTKALVILGVLVVVVVAEVVIYLKLAG